MLDIRRESIASRRRESMLPPPAAAGGRPPFISREAFRLLVQLESQKTDTVDVTALERRFRVPVGFGDEAGGRRALDQNRQVGRRINSSAQCSASQFACVD